MSAALETDLALRQPIVVRLVMALVMVLLAAVVAGPELGWDVANGNWGTAVAMGAFTAGYLVLVVRFVRLAVLTDGRRRVVRGMLRSRELDRSEIREVRASRGASSPPIGDMLHLVLANGKAVPLEVTARPPVPGSRRRAVAQRQQLEDWLNRHD